jgi:hypothetical protein
MSPADVSNRTDIFSSCCRNEGRKLKARVTRCDLSTAPRRLARPVTAASFRASYKPDTFAIHFFPDVEGNVCNTYTLPSSRYSQTQLCVFGPAQAPLSAVCPCRVPERYESARSLTDGRKLPANTLSHCSSDEFSRQNILSASNSLSKNTSPALLCMLLYQGISCPYERLRELNDMPVWPACFTPVSITLICCLNASPFLFASKERCWLQLTVGILRIWEILGSASVAQRGRLAGYTARSSST